jgi:hypothetical protein
MARAMSGDPSVTQADVERLIAANPNMAFAQGSEVRMI